MKRPEKRFLDTAIKEILSLCEKKSGKDNTAITESDIMRYIGQYPRYLMARWTLLKTVINIWIKFIRESHKGTQNMACHTFINKIRM